MFLLIEREPEKLGKSRRYNAELAQTSIDAKINKEIFNENNDSSRCFIFSLLGNRR